MTRTRVAVALAGLIGSAASVYAQSPATPTFSKDVAPILYQNCTNCHRTGEIGPMPLVSFSDARPWAKSIATRVASGTMPPWHADPAHGEFLNDRRLSNKDRDTIVKWASGGAPEGSPADLPKPPVFAEGWQIGQPDTIWSMLEDYPIPAGGTIEYKNFEVPTNLTEDRWAQAIEVRPGNR
jgi:mono/diheme cytochrome c family protein